MNAEEEALFKKNLEQWRNSPREPEYNLLRLHMAGLMESARIEERNRCIKVLQEEAGTYGLYGEGGQFDPAVALTVEFIKGG